MGEQKYNEALERARVNYNGCATESEKAMLEAIFPELKGSEDERIRKGLIKIIQNLDGGYPFEEHGIIKRDSLAWLEKQKPTEWSEEDKRILAEIIRHHEATLKCLATEERHKESKRWVDWLKSLRPQPRRCTFPVVRTKEIDEQMFDNIIARFNGAHFKHEQLQAMKEWLIELSGRFILEAK